MPGCRFVSGLIGIGGGVIIVPALILLFGFSQQVAQGTTLALLVPPIGLLAVTDYYKKGFVNMHAAIFICIGFVVGGLMGAKLAVTLPNKPCEEYLRRRLLSLVSGCSWLRDERAYNKMPNEQMHSYSCVSIYLRRIEKLKTLLVAFITITSQHV